MNAASTGRPFPRARRVRKRPDFLRIQDSPVRVSTRHLLVLLAPMRVAPTDAAAAASSAPELTSPETTPGAPPSLAPARLGVVASRKVGPAVARNRAKRLVRELFRLNPSLFPAGIDVVIIVRPGTHELAYADLEAELRPLRPLITKRAAEVLRASLRTSAPAVNPKRSGDR